MEVNLAVFVMATGIMAMVSLYPLGFRESEQSLEDVAGAAVADEILNPLAAGLSATNMTWSAWKGICGGDGVCPNGGWEAYFVSSNFKNPPKSKSGINSQAQQVLSKIAGAIPALPGGAQVVTSPPDGLCYALVASEGTLMNGSGAEEEDKQRIILCLRIAKRPGQIMSAPVYYTEVRFQGDPNL